MARYIWAVAVTAVCIGSAVNCSCRKAVSNPYSQDAACPVVFDETEIDVGSVYAETLPCQGSFFFINRSTETIELATQVCCGGKLEFADGKTVYGPGEKGRVVFSITGVGERRGLYRKKATVLQKANNQAVAILTLTAEIKRKARISPTYLDFGKVKPGQTLRARLVVASGTEEPLTITSVTTSLPGQLHVAYSPETDRTGLTRYLCEVSLTGNGKEGRVDELIFFETNCSDVDKIPVHVVAEMVGPVVIEPQSLFFGKVVPGASVSKSLHIGSTCDETLAVQSMSSTPDYVRLNGVSPSQDHGVDLALLLGSPSEASGILRGSLTIKATRTFGDSEEPTECTVPWVAFVNSD